MNTNLTISYAIEQAERAYALAARLAVQVNSLEERFRRIEAAQTDAEAASPAQDTQPPL